MTVVGLGEVLWDLLPGGKQLGGASANFAYHAQMLGAEAWLISRVGNDLMGREILERLKEMQLLSDGVTVDSSAPTERLTWNLPGMASPNSSSMKTLPGLYFGV
ncbi:MAG: PfkB family carbohydrate kinase [Limisphaerales bacterium]